MDKELERARVLDEILKYVDKCNPPGRASMAAYLAELEEELQTENVLLVRYLREEDDVFQIQASYEQMGKLQGAVVLTAEGKYKLKEEGPWYVSELESQRYVDKIAADVDKIRQTGIQERIKATEEKQKEQDRREARRKRFSWIYPSLVVAFAGAAAWGAIENKIHDKKELQWDQDKKAMQSQIDALTKQLNAIPDSIKMEYIK